MNSEPQLFCFTYAGGTKAFFDVIEQDMRGINVVKLEYAGHGERHKEEYYKTFDQLADDLLGKMNDRHFDGEYALFGYSMGSISLVEVLKKIIEKKMKLPSNVFLAAHEPYTKFNLMDLTSKELDEWVKERTIKFGAVPKKLISNRPFWRTYLPIFRADYKIIANYEFKKLNLKTYVPATLFYSETDTPEKEMELWKQYFIGETNFYRFSGGHFFIYEHHEEMARIITSKMGVDNVI